ncbi:alpha/beta-hydrolase [Plenodomus tracheiphilus IPT5]|uniref:Alpha/beta-hydrolase n=1 Tax=Plenodomus tracheiphilus IPT5 TaxID=1408161 RepID=A0A6A7B2I1_9PLEO|nr:alpha/beta-hydrolase [Plenodomus tracheiphilus IPT5]
MTIPLLVAIAATAFLPFGFGSPLAAGNNNGTMIYGFSELTANAELDWKPCLDNFTCALLAVPLDYDDPSIGTVNLAIVKRPGPAKDAQEVLVNPGGPGGSAVDMVLLDFAAIQDKVGSQYTLVGIDPRGVKNSGPSSDCFPPDRYPLAARNAFMQDVITPPDTTSDYTLQQGHQSLLAFGRWCTSIYSINNTAKYASTVATAQDMLHYIELSAKASKKAPEEAQLWYYGISYGSILGATIASLYPTRIGRMIIDGVLDLPDHYNGGWETATANSDAAAQSFFKDCFEAGPDLCLFHQNATSWQQLEKRYWNLLNGLRNTPLALGDPMLNITAGTEILLTPGILTWQDITSAMFSTSYFLSPALTYEMDRALVALQTRDTSILSFATTKTQILTAAPGYDTRMAMALVVCLDADGRANYTDFEAYKGFVGGMEEGSRYAGLSVAGYSGPLCSAFGVRAPEGQRFDGIPRVNGTSNPILFISGTADPITPLPAAEKMQGLFPGSGLLVWKGAGHTAHFRNSTCVSDYEKRYMVHGTLPPVNTTCELEQANPWIAYAETLSATGM